MYKKRHMPFYFSGMEIPFSFSERTLFCAEKGGGKTYRIIRWINLLLNQNFPFVFIQSVTEENKSSSEFTTGTFPFEYADKNIRIMSNIKMDLIPKGGTLDRMINIALGYGAHIFIDDVNPYMSKALNLLLEQDYHNCTIAVQSIYDCDKSIGVSFSEHLFDRIFIGKTSEAIIGSILGIDTMFLLDIKPKTFLQRK